MSITGKTILITGATSGIGEAVALELTRMEARVVGVGRNPERIAVSKQRIEQATGRKIDYLQADLASLAHVRQLAMEFREKYQLLDVLINNAGGFFLSRLQSYDGYEITFAINYLSHFLLTNLLLDLLIACTPARVVTVSSNAHFHQPLDFKDLQNKQRYWGWRAYGRAKFANILFSYELARRLAGTGVTSNVVHPGWVKTRIGQNGNPIYKLFQPLVQMGAKPPEDGARSIVYLASSEEVSGINGKFFVNCQAVPSDPGTFNKSSWLELWIASEKLCSIEGNSVFTHPAT